MAPCRPVLVAAVLLVCLMPIAPSVADETPPMLLGACDAGDLSQEPYDAWFTPGYEGYVPDPAVLAALRQQNVEGTELTIFFGTWCGDSRREVPRLLQLLDAMGWPEEQRRLVAVDRAESMHKRSPDGEERGLEIYRVPTLIIERDGVESGRIVEHPALSLERDLLAIVSGASYQPSYASYPVVRQWLQQGMLTDANINADGLAAQVRNLVADEGELYSAARVLWTRGDVQEAASLAAVNCALHWDNAVSHMQLAEAQIRAGQLAEARKSTLRAMRRNDDPERAEDLIDLIERSRVSEGGDDAEATANH